MIIEHLSCIDFKIILLERGVHEQKTTCIIRVLTFLCTVEM